MRPGRGAVVTGGGRGIGAATARALAEAGARVVVVARGAAEIELVAAKLAAAGHEVAAIACDVADPAAVERLRAAALERLGTVEILVNSAGVASSAPLVGEEAAAAVRGGDAISSATLTRRWPPIRTTPRIGTSSTNSRSSWPAPRRIGTAEAAVLIFLDIDGVLRRIGSPLDVLDTDCLGRFKAVVRAHPEVRAGASGLDAMVARRCQAQSASMCALLGATSPRPSEAATQPERSARDRRSLRPRLPARSAGYPGSG